MTAKKSAYSYFLPEELIASKPLTPRDRSRMMVLDRGTQSIEHGRFFHLPDILPRGSVLIVNDSRVIPARLHGKRQTGAKLEVLLIQETAPQIWECKVKNSSKIKIEENLEFCSGKLHAKLLEKKAGNCLLKFSCREDFYSLLEKFGCAPIPPYIRKARLKETPRREDLARYQTVYAREYGAIAAPTAGLHFTQGVLRRVAEKGIEVVEITLHVGLGTFEPMRTDDIGRHRMHAERYCISEKNAAEIANAKRQNRKIVAVGTTSVRALEAAWQGERIQFGERSTDLFIHPPYHFQVVDMLLTNFHLPESTLLMLVSAFAGKNFAMEAYQQAIEERYRFYSYGDCMLIR